MIRITLDFQVLHAYACVWQKININALKCQILVLNVTLENLIDLQTMVCKKYVKCNLQFLRYYLQSIKNFTGISQDINSIQKLFTKYAKPQFRCKSDLQRYLLGL